MKVTVFTSNQPRHLRLITRLAEIADSVFAVLECTTIFPGQVDDFYRNSPVMQRYLANVILAEREIFGEPRFLPGNVSTLSLRMGDLSGLNPASLGESFGSDVFIVFGSSFIRGWLADELISRSAVNIHMGLSPYYRGSSCNFWAMYDGRPSFVGGTIHYLSTGLDSGPIIAQVKPEYSGQNAFLFTMSAVEATQQRLVEEIESGTLLSRVPVPQDKTLELRYSRNADFIDSAAEDFLKNLPSPSELRSLLHSSEQPPRLI